MLKKCNGFLLWTLKDTPPSYIPYPTSIKYLPFSIHSSLYRRVEKSFEKWKWKGKKKVKEKKIHQENKIIKTSQISLLTQRVLNEQDVKSLSYSHRDTSLLHHSFPFPLSSLSWFHSIKIKMNKNRKNKDRRGKRTRRSSQHCKTKKIVTFFST